MNISELFIRRPVTTTLVMAAILVFGVIAYRSLPVSDLPNVDFPTIQVTRQPARRQPGDDGVVGGHAAREAVLDHRRPRLDDLDQRARASRRSRCSSTLDRNIDAAAQDVQAAIAKAARQLPPDMPTPPSYQKVNPADQPDPVSWRSARRRCRSPQVDEYAETLLAQRISMVSGVAQVQVFGSQKYAVRVQLDPRRAGRARHRHRRGGSGRAAAAT